MLSTTEPTLTFGWESLADLVREPGLKSLIAEHFEEIAEDQGECPLDVQWDHYLGLAARGILRVHVARGQDDELAGYCCWYVDRHPCYRALYAWASPFYLDPGYRRGISGYKFLSAGEGDLRSWGVKRLVIHCKVNHSLDRLFERGGYRLYETSFTKVL